MGQAITPQLVKALRDRTGIAVSKCKEALVEAKGNIELAIENMRKAGIASAVKKQDRTTNEGIVVFAESKDAYALVEVNAETDFVVKNDKFHQFAQNIATQIADTKPDSVDILLAQEYFEDPSLTVDEYRATVIQSIGENIQIKRLLVVQKASGHSIGIYSHMGGQIVCLVELEGVDQQEALARSIAMHVAAEAPEYLDETQVPVSVIDSEREIAKSQVQGKPDNIVEKIVEGKLNAYFDQVCLVRQKFIKQPDSSIEQVIKKAAPQAKICRFVRWTVGA